MREIKFRAWCEEDGCWYEYGTAIGSAPVFVELDRETESQYTGLTDTNGVEIFEGDILQCCGDGLKWVARFVNGSFVACNPDDYLDFVMLDDYRFLVIGNKYENPELLEQLK